MISSGTDGSDMFGLADIDQDIPSLKLSEPWV
jgi:hypothetical protein